MFITALTLCHPQLWPQTLTRQLPSGAPVSSATGRAGPIVATNSVPEAQSPEAPASGPETLPDAPDYPIAEVVAAPPPGVPVRLESRQQEKHGNVYTLTGEVRIDYKDYTLTADKVSYDELTKDAEADGHVRLQGRRNNELIIADHGNAQP